MSSEKIIQIEADSLAKAREQAQSQVPERMEILEEKILFVGDSGSVKATADTVATAFDKAENNVPDDAEIVERKEIVVPQHKTIIIEALDEQTARISAESQARTLLGDAAIVRNCKLVTEGKKGFLGIGKKSPQYEAELLRQATVEVTYRQKAKISIKIGKSLPPGQLGRNDDGQKGEEEIIEPIAALSFPFRVTHMAISSDGQLLALSVGPGMVVLHVETGEIVYAEELGYATNILGFSPDGKWLAWVGHRDSNTIRMKSMADGTRSYDIVGHNNGVRCLDFRPDGVLASGDQDGMVRVTRPHQNGTVFFSDESPVRALKFSPDGKLLLTANNSVKLWDFDNDQLLHTIDHPAIANVAFAPDGQTFAVSYEPSYKNGSISIYRTNDGQLLNTLDSIKGGNFESIAFSHDSKLLAVANKVWNTQIESFVYELPAKGIWDNANKVFSPVKNLLIVSGDKPGGWEWAWAEGGVLFYSNDKLSFTERTIKLDGPPIHTYTDKKMIESQDGPKCSACGTTTVIGATMLLLTGEDPEKGAKGANQCNNCKQVFCTQCAFDTGIALNRNNIVCPKCHSSEISPMMSLSNIESDREETHIAQLQLLEFIALMETMGISLRNDINKAAAMFAIRKLGYDLTRNAQVLDNEQYKVDMENEKITVSFPKGILKAEL